MATAGAEAGTNGIDVVSQARAEIRQEIQAAKAAANAAQKQQELAQKILQDLRDAETPARETVTADRQGRINERREEGNKVLKTLIRASEAAKANIPVLSLAKNQAVLANLAEKGLTISTASAIESTLSDYLLGSKEIIISQPGQPKSDFEIDFDQLKQIDLIAADLVYRSLIKTTQEGKLGINEQQLKERLDIDRYKKELEEQRKRMVQKSRRYPGEGEMSKLTDPEKRRLDQLSNKLQRSNLNFEQKQDINEMLRDAQLTNELKQLLADLGFSEQEIEEFRDLSKKAWEEYENGDYHYDNYFRIQDQEKFDIAYLQRNNLFDTDGLTIKGKRELKKAALLAVNRLMEKVDLHPDSDFQSNYSEFHEGYAYRYIQEVIKKLRDDPRWLQIYGGSDSRGYQEVMDFIKNGLLQEVGRERELRELFHNMGIYIKTLTPEKLAEYMQRYNTSTVSSVATNDFSGKLVALAMSEYERYLKFDIMKNKGTIRSGLFAGQTNPNKLYFENKDQDILRRRLKNVLNGLRSGLGYDSTKDLSPDEQRRVEEQYGFKEGSLKYFDIDSLLHFDDWELDRALKYAKGLELTQTIHGFEIIASSRPPRTYEGSADNMYDMASFINPGWKWRVGRGAAGPREIHIPEILISEGIVRRPKSSLLRRIFSKGWNPKAINKEIKSYAEYEASEKWEKLKDSWLYRDMDFRRLLNKFGLGGLAGRAAWRMVGFKGETFQKDISDIQEAIIDAVKKSSQELKSKLEPFEFAKDGERWVETYEQLAKVAGVGTRFWFDSDRAQDFIKERLWEKLGINPEKTNKDELDKLWFEYTEGKHGDKEIFKLSDSESYTALDFVEARTLVLRGLNFFDLLKRSPMDFLNNIVNLTPELLTEGLGGVSDLYFITDRKDLEIAIRNKLDAKGEKIYKTSADEENILREIIKFQRNAKRVWGEENFKHLRHVRDFYTRLERLGEKNKFFKDGKLDKETLFEYFFTQMDLAIERVKLRNGLKMKPNDIKDPDLKALIFGGKDVDGKEFEGLVPHFKNLEEDFGYDEKRDSDGNYDEKRDSDGNLVKGIKDVRLGSNGFFYHMARGWYNELGHALHPDTSDVDWRLVFHQLGARAGENLVKRLWGDLNIWNQVTNDLMNLDHLFMEAAEHHSLEKIFELHKKIHGLEGIAGKTAVYEMQYYLAQLVGRYFQEHHAARLPFPLGMIYGLLKGKELALSKIYGGRGAMTLTTDGLNAYFQKLMHSGMIMEEGQYGFDRLSKALGADWRKLAITEIIPSVFSILMLFLLWQYIKKAYSEAEGKKQ